MMHTDNVVVASTSSPASLLLYVLYDVFYALHNLMTMLVLHLQIIMQGMLLLLLMMISIFYERLRGMSE